MPGFKTFIRFAAAATLAALLTACGGGAAEDNSAPPASPPPVVVPSDSAPSISTAPLSQSVLTPGSATFTVAATGTAPLSYQWKRNGTDIAGATAASYTTPATAVGDDGASYTVVVSNAKGSATSSPATLSVAPGRVRLFASSWFEPALRITADVLSSTNPATPAMLTGGATGLTTSNATNDLAVDASRDLIYKVDSGIGGAIGRVQVWADAAALTGALTASRTITIKGATGGKAIALDAAADRIYVLVQTAAGRRLAIVNQASTRTGTTTPDALVDLGPASSAGANRMHLDVSNKRLYLTANSELYVFDGIGSAANGSVLTPARTVSFAGLSLMDVAVDATHNRLYLASMDNNTVYAFANASTLNGSIANPDQAAAARWTETQAVGVLVDSQDRVWWWGDSATKVSMYAKASTLSGLVTKPADKAVEGVIKFGYGVQLWLF